MIPVIEMTSAADVIANAKRVRGVFFPPRQPVLTRVAKTAKQAADELNVPAVTHQDNELFRDDADSLETPLTSAEVERDIIDLSTAEAPLSSLAKARRAVEAVARRHGITSEEILGKRQHKGVVAARHEAIAIVYQVNPRWTLERIGEFFGGRNHTTILHAIRVKKVWRGGRR